MPICRSFPAASRALQMSRPSLAFMVMGFSNRTCLPALNASIAIGACAQLGTQTVTASMLGSASSNWWWRTSWRPDGGGLLFQAIRQDVTEGDDFRVSDFRKRVGMD